MDRKKNNFKEVIAEYFRYFPKNFKIEGVFLFGSYARGKFDENSDIDLIVISPDFEKVDFLRRMEMLSSLRKSRLTRSMPMDIIGYTPEEFRHIDKESVIMKEAKKEGKMIR